MPPPKLAHTNRTRNHTKTAIQPAPAILQLFIHKLPLSLTPTPLATGKFSCFLLCNGFKTFCAGCVATLKMISCVDPKLELINKVQFALLLSNNVQRCSLHYRCNSLSRSLSDGPTLMMRFVFHIEPHMINVILNVTAQ